MAGAPNLEAEVQKSLAAYKSLMGGDGSNQVANPGFRRAFTESTGLQAYNLEALHSIYPVLTPIRNMTGRVKGKGRRVEYKAITGLNTAGLNILVAEGNSGSVVTTATEDITATYRSMAQDDTVTFEAEWEGYGFVDVKALAVTNLLRSVMIGEENLILFGQNSVASSAEQSPGSTGAPAAPTVATSSVVGSLSNSTAYYFKCTTITAMGESTVSTSGTATTGSGDTSLSVTPNPPASGTFPILGYNVYACTSSGGTYHLVTSAYVQAVQSYGISPFNGTGVGATGWITNGTAIIVTSIPTTTAVVPVADTTGNALSFNGIYTQMCGASTTGQLSFAGAVLSQSLLNAMFRNLWQNVRGDPNGVWCNVYESEKITSLTLGAGTPYSVFVNQDQVAGAVANFRVARYTNPATGSEVPIRVHPTVPQGTMLFLQNQLPSWYVPTDIPTVWEMDLPQDYTEIDYPPTVGSGTALWTAEVRLLGALKLYAPLLQGALSGIIPS